MTNLRILFMGTPDFAEMSLSALCDAGANVIGVITGEDKMKGRGMKLSFSEVKTKALEKSLPVFQPQTLKDGSISELLCELAPDVIVVVAYGKILPEYVLNFPKYGCINVHGSLLPEYRGAAPIQRAVLDGKTKTGVTTMYMDKGLDTGDIIFSEEVQIGENETVGELWDRLGILGGKLLIKTLDAIADGTAPRTKQDDSLATYAAKIDRDEKKVDFALTAKEVHNKIRGMSPYPAAHALLDGTPTKLYGTKYLNINTGKKPGEIVNFCPDGVVVACGEGAVSISDLKPDGSKMMSVKDMINGRKISQNSIFS